MQTRTAALLVALLAAFGPAPAAASVSRTRHPMEDIITLLENLAQKAEEEGKEEALTYEKFTYWCHNSEKTLDKTIANEKTTIDELSALIDSKEKAEEVLTAQVTHLAQELANLAAAGVAASNSRSGTQSVYDGEEQALTATVDAIKDCISALEIAKYNTDTKTSADTAPNTVLLQRKLQQVMGLVATKASESQLVLLKQFAEQPVERPELGAEGDLDAHTKKYSFKSQSVIELLKGLLKKFEDEHLDTVKAETASINAYELAKDARDDLINAATEQKTVKGLELTAVQEALIQGRADKSSEEADLAADEKTLSDTTQSCHRKATEWAERSETRRSEIEALKAAREIIAKQTGIRTEAPSNPVPPPSPVAETNFLQLALQTANPDQKMKAVNLLREEAKVAHSRALEQLAQQVAAHLSGPFDDVNNMIEKMIYRLMDEQKNEDEHKHWCDLELEKTNTSKTDKEDKIAELTAKINAGVGKSTLLGEDISEANSKISDITGHMAQAADIRKIGKEENRLAIKDSEDAQTALSNAIAVLEAYYKESKMIPKESWEFLQRQDPGQVTLPDTPSTWDSAYTGVADPEHPENGILSMLKKIDSEFAEMESQTRAQEESDQDAFDEDMKDCSIEKARLVKEAEMKTQEQKRVDNKVSSQEKARKGVSKELEAVEQYLTDLEPACVTGDSTYEGRKADRAKEITSLKEAKDILADAFNEKPSTTGAGFLQKRK